MKNVYIYLFIGLIVFTPNWVFSQCTANFTFDETNLNIQFTDLSSADANDMVVSWLWDFEDGTTSTLQNPSHTFPEPNVYDVLLIITTASGCTDEFEVRIEICAFDVEINIGQCNSDGTVDVSITVHDLFDNAKDINLSIDGQIISGSPFEIDGENPVNTMYTLPGDGLTHNLTVQSEDIGTCVKSVDFTVADCNSDCFLAGLSTKVSSGMTHSVEIGDNFFNPVNTTITLGDLVRFNWTGDGHSTTSDASSGSDSWNSGEIDAGSVYDVLLTEPGVHPFYCIPHGGPGGVGMSGSIIANCPSNNQVELSVNFQASQVNPAGYNVFIDGGLVNGSPFNYTNAGNQSLTLILAGDGLTHTIIIEDVTDPACTLNTQWQAPDCGATPACNLSITATENGACNTMNEVSAELQITAINPGDQGFNLLIDGSSAGSFNYDPSGTTSININLPGDGNSHDIQVVDLAQNSCSAATSIVTTNCSIPCSISNLNILDNESTIHTVNVEDFTFSPKDITITEGDIVEWQWTGSIAHTSTSDASSGPDAWDSGLLSTGATFPSPVLSLGIHPYYCIPHGGPGGQGMAGTITVQPDCTNGLVSTSLQFQHSGGSFNGFILRVDNVQQGTYTYHPSGTNTLNFSLPGDGQTHTIQIVDADDPACSASSTLTTSDCNAIPCQLTLSAQETGNCDANDQLSIQLSITDNGGGDSGFEIFADGTNAGTFAYDPSGTTSININLPGDGNSHDIQVVDLAQNSCSANTSIITTNCSIPCSISNLNILDNESTIHTVNVEDFTFAPKDITITEGDIVEWQWTGSIAHTSTSDASSGPDAWDSGLLSTGVTFPSPVLSLGIHPYYCIPHGGPGGQGMAGTITVQPDCTNGLVSTSLQFQHSGGSFNGFVLRVDNVQQGTYSYDPSGVTSLNFSLPGDGQTHTIQIVDADDPTCSASTTLTTSDCNAVPCQLTLSAQETGNCDTNDQLSVQLNITDNGGGDSGFEIFVDGTSAGSFIYDPSGTTSITINLPGDGNSHDLQVVDLAQNSCSAATSIITTNCSIPCSISNLNILDNQSTIHTVNVEDFTFAPKDITITQGDIVEWQWTGSIAHTSTSDASSGPDAWDSGLLSTGASFPSPVLSLGIHPYYCIPHGGPGGQGMAGTITVQPDCANGLVSVSLQFQHSGGSFNGFVLSVDNVQQGTYSYDPSGVTSLNFSLPGDGQMHTIQIVDADDPACFASTTLTTTDCNAVPCQLTLSAQETGNCDTNGQLSVQLSITDNGGGDSGFEIFVDGTSAGSFNYDPSGTTNVDINLPGDGNSHDLQVVDLAQNSCSATTSIITTDCTPPCSISLSVEQLSTCENSLVNFSIIVNATGQGAQFEVLLDGALIPENPFEYQGTNTSINIAIPGDGDLHEIEIRDVQQADCSANIFLNTPDCESACGFDNFEYNEHVPTTHTIEVLDFSFAPKDITVEVGDTILWIWTGEIPHTTTSDTIEGPDSWNSGLLGQGAEFSIVIQEAGFHPYYCIPHGSPGGIGMAGTITATDICADEQLNAGFSFVHTNAGLNGYQVIIDGNPVSGNPFEYSSNTPNMWTSSIPAIGQQIALSISDIDDPDCRLDTLLQMPACNDPCFRFTADFTTQINHANLQVAFTSNSTGVQQWLWSFGDGNQSTDESPQHQYAAEGEYEVCLEVQNEINCLSQTCTTIFVGTFICQADFNYDSEGLTIYFSNHSESSDSITNWIWNFGDGFLQEGISNPVYTYDSLGIYEVCLSIIGGNCQTDTCLTLDLSDPCLTFDAAFDFSVNADHSIQFIDLSGEGANQWLWGFGDGQTSNEQFPTHHYSEVGTYNVCLLVQDTLQACNSALCSTIDILITQVEQAPNRLRLTGFPNPVSAGQTVYFRGIPSTDYGQVLSWSIVDLHGRIVDQGTILAEEQAALAVSKTLARGIYHIQIIGKDQTYWHRLAIQ